MRWSGQSSKYRSGAGGVRGSELLEHYGKKRVLSSVQQSLRWVHISDNMGFVSVQCSTSVRNTNPRVPRFNPRPLNSPPPANAVLWEASMSPILTLEPSASASAPVNGKTKTTGPLR